jgi:hypothetical protein
MRIKKTSQYIENGLSISDIYPVGSIYISVNNTNPSSFFGGTWEAFGAGKVLVGQDTNDTDFDTLEETGGSKYIQQHQHNATTPFIYSTNQIGPGGDIGWVNSPSSISSYTTRDSGNVKSGVQTGNSGNLQPYIVVSMWKRTA